jgi:hypothetical protein
VYRVCVTLHCNITHGPILKNRKNYAATQAQDFLNVMGGKKKCDKLKLKYIHERSHVATQEHTK